MEKPLTILVRMPNWLGDCVMAMPALRHICETLPQAKIYLSGRRQFGGLFMSQPGVSGFVEAPGSGLGNLVKGLAGAKRRVRGAGVPMPVDFGLLFTNSLSTALWMWRSGAQRRVGYSLDSRRLFLTDPVPCGGVEKSRHFINYYLWLAQTLESALSEGGETPCRQVAPLADYHYPSICVSDAGRNEAARIAHSLGCAGRYAVIAPASAYGPVKDWPVENYRALVKTLNHEFGLSVLVTGAAAQKDVCQAIADDQKAAYNTAGLTSLDGFLGMLADARAFIGGDSGGAHVAAALSIPTIVIFGITNPSRTRPTGRRVASLGEGAEKDIKLNTPRARAAAKHALASIRPEQVAKKLAALFAADSVGKE